PGVIDPAAKGRSQKDGTQLIELYRQAGLNISAADNAVEAGIYACDQLMHAGKLKAFTSLRHYYSELRAYRRDKDGKSVEELDHLMDGKRYLIMSGRDRMVTKPKSTTDDDAERWWRTHYSGDPASSWMQ